jgi:ornithine carbamoyltransferase (EC 2.1.3.3)
MHPIALNWNELQLSRGEPLSDTARVFGKMVHCVAARVFSHDDLYTFRDYAKIPIINALSDKEHPLQALADFMTIKEKFGDFKKVKIAYVGDGNNVANSLILATAKVGAYISVATPLNLKPSPDIVARAKIEARKTGAKIEIDTNPQKAVESADVVYTDVWVSMGQEAEASSKIELLKGYQVNDQLFALAKPEAYFMHCLPAHRGQEVTESVIDGPRSIVFEQAENRLYTTIAVFYSVL